MKKHNQIRDYLYQVRAKKGLSMRAVSILAGLAFQHYQMIENGDKGSRISFMTMVYISKALEMPLDFIAIEEEKYLVTNNMIK